MLRWKQGHQFYLTSVEDLKGGRKGACQHFNASSGPRLHANMGQSSGCVRLQFVTLANSVTQAEGFEWHIGVEAKPLIAPHCY